MTFEEQIANLNEFFFFKEFTFSSMTFRPSAGNVLELADNVINIDDLLLVYQLKERHAPDDTTPDAEVKWFDNKVLKRGKNQIRDTLTYLDEYSPIQIENHRGLAFEINRDQISHIDKLIVYHPDPKLPAKCANIKFYQSSVAGNIHIIQTVDYLGICKTLVTPVEVHDYLSFREDLWGNHSVKVENCPEQAIVGQYLSGELDAEPDTRYIEYLFALKQNRIEWNIAGIIRHFPESVITDNKPNDYYKIIVEIAKLKRSELKAFKERFVLSVDQANKNEFVLPFRMTIPRTGCGFVFIPIDDRLKETMQTGLMNLTDAHKYDQKLDKCIGVTFLKEGEHFLINWCYLERPWTPDLDFEKKLKSNYPFRKVEVHEVSPYSFQ